MCSDRLVCWSALVFTALGVAPLAAQNGLGRIRGKVLGDGGPVAGAEVGLLGGAVRTLTSDSGTFSLRDVPAGTARVYVRAVGYAPIEVSIVVDSAGVTQRDLTLTRVGPVVLPEVTANARWGKPARLAGTTKYDDFYRRRRVGFGTFLTREDIEKSTALRSFELLRGVPGIRVNWNPPGVPGTEVVFGRCDAFPPRVSVWIDGKKQMFTLPPAPPSMASGSRRGSISEVLEWKAETWRRWLELFDAVRPGEIEGVEIFRGVAQIPAEFLDDSCAAVVIWTREGGRG